MQLKKMIVFTAFVVVAAWCISDVALAQTVAYWRMESSPDQGAVVAGTQVEDTNGRVITPNPPGIRLYDFSGNGNSAVAWEHSWAGHAYRADVPLATVP